MPIQLEQNLLRTFRLFLTIRIVLTFVFLFIGNEPIELPVITISSLIVTIAILLYLNMEFFARYLRQAYLPIAIAAMTLLLILEQRFIQFQLAQLNLTLLRDVPEFLEAFTLPGTENATIPLLLTLTTTASLFVPLVLMCWQYRFRSVIIFVIGITILDIALILTFSRYVRFDIPIEIVGVIVRDIAFLIVGFIVTEIMKTQRQQREQLSNINRKLVEYATTREQLFVTQERNRLARELHDTLAHTLSAVTVKLNAIQVLWENDAPRAKHMLSEVIETLNDGNAETRRALRDLRASPLDDMGLVLAIRHLAEVSAQRGNFALDLHTPQRDLRFEPAIEQAVYRISQEALSNTVEHANAKHVSVEMQYADNCLQLSIADDGCGFVTDNIAIDQHFGIIGMRERSEMINGKLSIDSTQGKGTQVSFAVEVEP